MSASVIASAMRPPKPSRSRACEPCRKKKLRCDTVRPYCQSCVDGKRTEQCIYLGVPKPYSKKVTKEVQELEDRVKALERLISTPGMTAMHGMYSDPSLSLPDHIPGVTIKPEPPSQPTGPAVAAGSPPFTSADEAADPNPLELATSFFDGEMAHFPLNMVHAHTFLTHMDDPAVISPILRFAVLGCGARMAKDRDDVMMERSENMFMRCRGLIHRYIDEPTMQALQAVLILCLCSAATNRQSAASMYLGIVTTMALILKLDVDPDDLPNPPSGFVAKETHRRTWWALYSFDRMVSGVTQRPPILHEISPDAVKFPADDVLWESRTDLTTLPPEIAAATSKEPSLFRHFWGILDLFQRVVAYSRGPGGVRDRNGQPGRGQSHEGFLELERGISDWFYGLPAWMREKVLGIHEEREMTASFVPGHGRVPWLVVIIQLAYYGVLCILHRPRLILALGVKGTAEGQINRWNDRVDEGFMIKLSCKHGGDNPWPSPSPRGGTPTPSQSSGTRTPSASAYPISPPSQDFPDGATADFVDAIRNASVGPTGASSMYQIPSDPALRELMADMFGSTPPSSTLATSTTSFPASAFTLPDSASSFSATTTSSPIPLIKQESPPLTSTVIPIPDSSSTAAPAIVPTVSSSELAFSLRQGHAAALAIATLVRSLPPSSYLSLSSYGGLSVVEAALVLMLVVTRGIEGGRSRDLGAALEARRGIASCELCLDILGGSFFMYRFSVTGVRAMAAEAPSVEELEAMMAEATVRDSLPVVGDARNDGMAHLLDQLDVGLGGAAVNPQFNVGNLGMGADATDLTFMDLLGNSGINEFELFYQQDVFAMLGQQMKEQQGQRT
ncbi:hypothetical protein HK101_011497 [Irineochytrium annulatum]|nr:hypothetical protein HK101_011497 [Irineochytrium annulatum]